MEERGSLGCKQLSKDETDGGSSAATGEQSRKSDGGLVGEDVQIGLNCSQYMEDDITSDGEETEVVSDSEATLPSQQSEEEEDQHT